MKVQKVSSRWTFLFKWVLPIFWGLFMGGVALVICLSPLEELQKPFDPLSAKILVVSFYLTVLGLLFLLFRSAKWVGITDTHIYVSDYFNSYKYTLDSIKGFDEVNMLLYTKVIIHFHQPTAKFGQHIFFIRSYYWKYFLEKHPHVLEQIFSTLPKGEGLITEEKGR